MPRKKPYSGKQKKKQLKEKKQREGSTTRSKSRERWRFLEVNEPRRSSTNSSPSRESDASSNDGSQGRSERVKVTDRVGRSNDPRERYRLNFLRESRDEIEMRKTEAQSEILVAVKPEDMEHSIDEIYQPGSELDMPQRPLWKYGESKEKVEQREEDYFRNYLEGIYAKFEGKNLSYFEHNLETWRQLWRVLEMSDVIAMVADVRHPVLHFSPALYNYVTQTASKPLILVLNKIDLVPAPVVIAWKKYFESKFPNLNIVTFTSFPKDFRGTKVSKKVRKRKPVGKRVYTTQIGPHDLLQVCRDICGDKVNLGSWEKKIINDLENMNYDLENFQNAEKSHGDGDHGYASTEEHKLFKDGRLTLGFVGHPNVGKSSLMNGLIGKKVVSTSVTPGHTKYFQTYFLTPTVMLCDCPGLVFPSLIEKQMQILSGIYPIAQVQEPYTPVGYLACRIPVVKLLGVFHPDSENDGEVLEWTAWDVCEAWAEKRRFYTAKGRRPDVYRAANNILRMAVDGRLCMFMLPPGFTSEEEKWSFHPETSKLLDLTSDPLSRRDLLSFHDSFGGLESSERDSAESSDEESASSHQHGDGGRNLATQNKFALLGNNEDGSSECED